MEPKGQSPQGKARDASTKTVWPIHHDVVASVVSLRRGLRLYRMGRHRLKGHPIAWGASACSGSPATTRMEAEGDKEGRERTGVSKGRGKWG